jgi:flagellar biogenesis protein FliO
MAGGSAWFARWFVALASFLRRMKVVRREKTLRLCETLPLGEKRFLAVVQCERQRFLIAATNQSISLIERLDGTASERHRLESPDQEPFLGGAR